jgi:hypothetical protein
MEGTVDITPGYYESYQVRESILSKGMDAYAKAIKASKEFHTANISVDSLKQFEEPVKIHYDVKISPENEGDILYFNPFLTGRYKENPFQYADRKYPVEMDYPINELYILNMEVPDGYKIDELPKSVKVKFNENEGIFEYIVRTDNKNIQLICKINLYNATFDPTDYQVLREFFAFVVKKENEQFVFKKVK